MSQEQPKEYSKEEIEEMDKVRDRVEGLGDSMYDLADDQNKFRNKLIDNNVIHKNSSKLAEDYSDQVFEKIEAQKKLLKAEEGSFIDPLTGLKNRRALNEEMSREFKLLQRQTIEEEKRKRMDCSFLIIDLDDFKNINDTYGHLGGDYVLKELSECMRNVARSEDITCRYGGDEFVMFLPDTDAEGAHKLAERLMEKISKVTINFEKNGKKNEIKFNVSIGGASIKDVENWKDKNVEEIIEELTKKSDSALYESKEAGKNKITFFDKEIELRSK